MAPAADIGLPSGLPVIAGTADKACEVLGSDCLAPYIACLSCGTTAVCRAPAGGIPAGARWRPGRPGPRCESDADQNTTRAIASPVTTATPVATMPGIMKE